MGSSYSFAVGVFRCICERFAARAAELGQMTETASSFEEWVNWEAFLACKHREAGDSFCEVTAKPTYASEGVDEGGVGELRVGGPNDGADHCWLFAEIVLLHDGNRDAEWREKISADADRLRRLGWKKSAALLVVVSASLGDPPTERVESAVENRPPLTEPFVIPLPGGGVVTITAFDIKRDPADTLTATSA